MKKNEIKLSANVRDEMIKKLTEELKDNYEIKANEYSIGAIWLAQSIGLIELDTAFLAIEAINENVKITYNMIKRWEDLV